MDSFNSIPLFMLLRELIKLTWIATLVSVFVSIYLIALYLKKTKNYTKMTDKLGYPMAPISNTFLGHVMEHTSVRKQVEWHKQLGKLYGFYNCDTPHLRVSNLNIIGEVFLKQSKIFAARTYNEYRLTPFNDGILFSHGAVWRRARRLIQPIMSAFRMRSSAGAGGETTSCSIDEQLSKGIERLVGHLKQLTSTAPMETGDLKPETDLAKREASSRYCEINRKGYAPVLDSSSPTGCSIDMKVHDVMEALTLDIIMRIGLNINEVDVLKGASDPLVKFVDSWLRDFDDPIAKIAQAVPLFRLLVPFILAFNKSFRRYYHFMMSKFEQHKRKLPGEVGGCVGVTNSGLAKAAAAAAQANGTRCNRNRRSVFEALIEEYRAGRMRKREVIANASATIVAGFETTATTLAYIIWSVARHPKLKAKLLADIVANGIRSRYLDMFIKETMRMYPALANFVIRSPIEDTVIAGRTIERGMSVYLDMLTVHYDETIHPDPYKFDPERFAEGRTYPPGAYAPFGLGHRMCAGTHLAMREMKVIVSELLKNFDIELISPQLELELESKSIFLTRSKHDIRVRLIPRSDADVGTTETLKE